MFTAPLCFVLLLPAADQPTPKVPPGKDTTFFDGPLDKDGFIDYEAAINERLGKGVPAAKNANVLIWKALGPTPEGSHMPKAFFIAMGIDEPPADGQYVIGINNFVKENLKLDRADWESVFDLQQRAMKRPWNSNQFPQIAEWIRVNEKPLAVVAEATRRPEYFNPLTSNRAAGDPSNLLGCLLPGVQKCRQAATLLLARAMLRVGEEKYDEAWQDLLACHRLGRLVSRGATLIEALVGIAINQMASNAELAYLERAPLNSQQIQQRIQDLASLPPLSPLADKVALGERCMYLDAFQSIRRGGAGALEAIAGGNAQERPDPEVVKLLDKLDWAPALRNGNKWYDRIAAAMRLPDRADRVKALNQIDNDFKAMKGELSKPAIIDKLKLKKDAIDQTIVESLGQVLSASILPAVAKVQDAYDRSEQVQRNLNLAFRLAAHKAEHGRYPERLDELSKRNQPPVPNDLFSGKQLIYRPTSNGYLLYSVGPNGQDDDGRGMDDEPRGDDLSVRMPLPRLKPKE